MLFTNDLIQLLEWLSWFNLKKYQQHLHDSISGMPKVTEKLIMNNIHYTLDINTDNPRQQFTGLDVIISEKRETNK